MAWETSAALLGGVGKSLTNFGVSPPPWVGLFLDGDFGFAWLVFLLFLPGVSPLSVSLLRLNLVGSGDGEDEG